MFLAAVHLAPAFTMPPALALSAVCVWYWLRLGRSAVPVSRRKVRRFSLAIVLLSLPMAVRALSFVDPNLDKHGYAIAWTFVMLMVLLLVAAALMDAINNLRIHQQQKHDELTAAATDLALAIRDRRQREATAMHASGVPERKA